MTLLASYLLIGLFIYKILQPHVYGKMKHFSWCVFSWMIILFAIHFAIYFWPTLVI
jgi:hypothetical protein